MIRSHVLICGGTGCTSSGSVTLQKAFNENIEAFGLAEEVKLVQTGCIGFCQLEPIVEVIEAGKEKVTYVKMTPDKAKEVVEKHLKGGNVVAEYTVANAKI